MASLTAQGLDVAGGQGVSLRLGPRQREALALLAGSPEGLETAQLAARGIGSPALSRLVALGLVTWSPNWFVWAALVFFFVGFRHSAPLDDVTPLTPSRRLLGYVCLALLVVLIPPVPVELG